MLLRIIILRMRHQYIDPKLLQYSLPLLQMRRLMLLNRTLNKVQRLKSQQKIQRKKRKKKRRNLSKNKFIDQNKFKLKLRSKRLRL
jgi:hypothetical protein